MTVRPKMSKIAAIDHAGFGQLGNSEMSQVVDDSTWTFSLQVMEVAMPVSNPDANSVVGIGRLRNKLRCASTFTNRKDKPHPAHTFCWLWYVSILPLRFFCDAAAAGPAAPGGGYGGATVHCRGVASGGCCAQMRRTERTHQLRNAGATDARATDAGRF